MLFYRIVFPSQCLMTIFLFAARHSRPVTVSRMDVGTAQALFTSGSLHGSAQNGTIWSYHKSSLSQASGDWPPSSQRGSRAIGWSRTMAATESSSGQHGRPTTLESPQCMFPSVCHLVSSVSWSLVTHSCILSVWQHSFPPGYQWTLCSVSLEDQY